MPRSEVEKLVRAIVQYIANTSQRESIFLTPYPQTTVDAYNLLDFISARAKIDKVTIGRWCDEKLDKK